MDFSLGERYRYRSTFADLPPGPDNMRNPLRAKVSRMLDTIEAENNGFFDALQRFAAGEHGFTLTSAQKLSEVLGWEFRPIAKKKGR